jgi:hypothetical protein
MVRTLYIRFLTTDADPKMLDWHIEAHARRTSARDVPDAEIEAVSVRDRRVRGPVDDQYAVLAVVDLVYKEPA